ncbi:putative HTH-type transcriptional regulator YjiR [Marinomonas gallaica]|uniref:HTH-type transcriptional regulator YjiR n=1 Tax=Marinomonas gallaica TaxID=1806667 RepID=A0A1C3JR42_9GAMM|nr:PLP-dependent aminotransferase family protein [Marinomonas gallaica]SBT17673.1 putative HTH-type transcriptional regulator YjiR [Marinomonas gallaica]SBT19999.1 putative HTH-type transcriptional regulator YjiR [Marinomonas gallaica]
MSLYESLAQTFIDDIVSERLPIGSRLPALRQLAQQQGVSLTTASKAYDCLQEGGWIYARPQAGYFVASRSEIAEFPTLKHPRLTARDPSQFAPKQGYNSGLTGFTPLGTSLLAPALLPEVELSRTIKRVTRRASQTIFSYPELQGVASLRQALSEHFLESHFAFTAQELVITNSCLDSVRIALECVTQPGDTIAVCSPCFSGLLDLLTTLKRRIIEIPVTHDGIDLIALETCFSEQKVSAALLSTTHLNPLGITLPTEQKQAIAQLAAQYQMPIIEDDVYFELSHHKDKPLPAKYWDKEGYILWCSSISKTLAPGLRLGWCLPGRYFEPFLHHHSQTSMGVNSLVQACIAEFILCGEYRRHIHQIRPILQSQVHQYRQFLSEHLPESAQISAPQGGLVIWVRVPHLDSDQLAQDLGKMGIDIRRGSCFSTHPDYNDCLRINCGWPLYLEIDSQSSASQLKHLCQLVINQVKPLAAPIPLGDIAR